MTTVHFLLKVQKHTAGECVFVVDSHGAIRPAVRAPPSREAPLGAFLSFLVHLETRLHGVHQNTIGHVLYHGLVIYGYNYFPVYSLQKMYRNLFR